ncbi:MAG: hypothetical protein ACHWZW_03120 [Spirulina sp.]
MAPRNGGNVHQETLRFNLDNPEQARALEIYKAMIEYHPYAKSLCTLLPHVLTVYAEQAQHHPALNNRQAALIAKYADQVQSLIAALEAGEAPPVPSKSDTPSPGPPPAPAPGGGAIEVDLSVL